MVGDGYPVGIQRAHLLRHGLFAGRHAQDICRMVACRVGRDRGLTSSEPEPGGQEHTSASGEQRGVVKLVAGLRGVRKRRAQRVHACRLAEGIPQPRQRLEGSDSSAADAVGEITRRRIRSGPQQTAHLFKGLLSGDVRHVVSSKDEASPLPVHIAQPRLGDDDAIESRGPRLSAVLFDHGPHVGVGLGAFNGPRAGELVLRLARPGRSG